ncbi:MAG: hypothetical protein ABI267_03835 [Ginsengibacter sp.]
MQDLITSFIIQSKECKLSDIGNFRVINNSAEPDIANKKISPAIDEILFSEREEKISDELVKYIATQNHISLEEALNDLKNWCAEAKIKLQNGEELLFEPFGFLKKGDSDNIFFHSYKKTELFEPVLAQRVIHKNSDHAVLVGDRETTSSAMNEYYQEVPPTAKGNTWKILAGIFLAIALFLLFLHFYKNPFALSTIGNQHHVVPNSAPNTYTKQ